VTGEWRKLHNEELNDLYSPHILRVIKCGRIRWAGHVAHVGERRGIYRVLVGKPEGKRSLGRLRHRWEGKTKIDIQDEGCGCMGCIYLANDRARWQALLTAIVNLRVP